MHLQLIINDKQYTEYKGHTSQALMLCSVLLRRRFGPSYFALPTRFYVHECHQMIVKPPTAEKVSPFFSFPLRGNQTDGGKQFMITELRDCLSSGWKILEYVRAIACSSKSLLFGSSFHWFQRRAVEVHSLGSYALVFRAISRKWTWT